VSQPRISGADPEDATRTAGVDEAGRGALFGPVVAAAVILDPGLGCWEGVRDSKIVPEGERESLFDRITSRSDAWAIGLADPEEIDRTDILKATLAAMARAVGGLSIPPAKVLVDGNRPPRLEYPVEAVVHGDRTVLCISAASLLAKVWRDRLVRELALRCPGFGLDRNKGYGTREHLDALRRLGPTVYHRRTFRGVLARGCGPGNPPQQALPGFR
jgi:ribonuclease HII